MSISSSTYHHVAVIQVNDHNQIDLIRSELAQLINFTQQETDCIDFQIMESVEETGTFYLWEAWQNKQALEKHFDMPYTKAYLSKNYTKVISITELNILSE